jgi:LPS-assembly protein
MGETRFLAAALLLCALGPVAAPAQRLRAPQAEYGEISIDAAQISYDKKTDTVSAHGTVVIKRGDSELHADDVCLNRTTNEAEARGHVRVTDPEGTIVADALRLNLDDETGFLEHAEVTSSEYEYSLTGKRIEKGLGQSYHIENGRFTTCHCAEGAPSWSISGQDIDVTLGGYGKLEGGTFNVLDVPVLYLPRAVFPVQRERQSGFLLPQFGFSNRSGFRTLLPFYWAIDKSQDATVSFDLETSARIGALGEYRYALSRGSRGFISGSYFNEFFRGAPATEPSGGPPPENRWSAATEQDQVLGEHSKAYSDVFIVSDDLFVREINLYAFEPRREVAVRTLPFTDSHAGVVQLWDRFAAKGEGTYYQDLTGSPDALTLQRAPVVDTWGQAPLSEYVLGDLTAEAVDYQREQSVDGFRVDIEPGATVPLPLGRYAFGAVRASASETAYHLTETTVSDSGMGGGVPSAMKTLPRDQSRELIKVVAGVGTVFNRVYHVHWLQLQKLNHTLEPEIEYLYIPAVNQSDLPLFDGIDRVNQRNLFTYGLVSRFIGKFAEQEPDDRALFERTQGSTTSYTRELARLSIAQSVDVARSISPIETGRASDHFSDIDFGAELNPSRALSVRFHANYDTGISDFSSTRVGFFLQDPRNLGSKDERPRLETRTSVGVSYRLLTGNLLQEIDSNVVLRLTKWAGFLYSSRYDVVTDSFLSQFYGLRLLSTCDCWALDLAVANTTNPQETQVRAQLTLVGLGSSKRQRRVASVPD